MAFIKGPGSWKGEDEEEGSGVIGGGSSVGGMGAAGGQGTGSWTNLQQYLKANEGGGERIANSITKSTQDDVDAVGQQRVEFEQKAKKQVDDKTKKDQFSSQILADPTKVNKDEYSSWKNLSNYWGANDATGSDGYGQVKGKVDSIQNNINTANDYYGQNVLANNAFGKGPNQYSQGMGYLDTFFARSDQSGKDAFKNFQDRNAGFSKDWNDTSSRVNDYIGGAAGRGQAAYDSTMGAIGQKRNTIKSAAQQRADSNSDKSKAYEHLRSSGPSTGWDVNNESLDKYVYRNSDFDGNDVLSDPEIEALNALAGFDGSDAVTRGSDNPYVADTDGYAKWKAAQVDQIGVGNATPNNQVPGIVTAPPLPQVPVGPTPTPTPTPTPVPVPVGPTPAPSPTAPLPTPVPVGPTPLPTAGGILSGTGGIQSGGDPRLGGSVNTGGAAKPWPATRPANYPSFMPYPPSFPNQGQFD